MTEKTRTYVAGTYTTANQQCRAKGCDQKGTLFVREVGDTRKLALCQTHFYQFAPRFGVSFAEVKPAKRRWSRSRRGW